ncbi:MAG: prepilin-type N-terminal cleavage/methylation domain-containing protein [Fibrobacteria bacterium]|nr:prepilin-type N-terminal cleavage/methylation domain-containing protein [Fibrobacteria bacterium]
MTKKTNKKLKGQQGFTLVEVIVVAVIVAVLAAVAVPIYLEYIEDARVNQSDNVAGSVASFCGACASNNDDCSSPTSGTKMYCDNGSGTDPAIVIPTEITVTVNSTAGTVVARHSQADTTSETYYYK